MATAPRRFSSALPWIALAVQILPNIVSMFKRKVPNDAVVSDQQEAKDAKRRISRRPRVVKS